MTYTIRVSILAICTSLLAGCSSHTAPELPPVTNEPAAVKLAEAATSVSHSLNDLAAVSEANTPGYYNYKSLPNLSPDQLHGTASVDWSGPIEPLLRRLSNVCGYKFRVLGRRPAIPVIVTITAKNLPVAYIIRDAAFQAENRAKVYAFPDHRIIELRYMSP